MDMLPPNPLLLSDPQLRANPYPIYAQFRRTQPLARIHLKEMGAGWLVSRYEDVAWVLKDPSFSNDARHSARGRPWVLPGLPRLLRSFQQSMANMDDPNHARLRNLVHQAFTPKRVEAMTAQIERIIHTLLDAAAAKGPVVDFIADFALPLPLTVIATMMGIAPHDQQQLRHWLVQLLAPRTRTPLDFLFTIAIVYQIQNTFRRLIQQRRAAPQDDLISALVAAEQAGDRLSEDELLAMIFLLLFAGHETTANLLGNGTLALLMHPVQWRELSQTPALAATAVEELLRFTNPVKTGAAHYVREAVTLHGQTLPPKSMVLALLAAANRDETVFENPNTLDLARHPNRHLAFGAGVHYCLGAPLARLEAQLAFTALTQRFPTLRLAVPPTQLRWRNNLNLHGLKALPVQLA